MTVEVWKSSFDVLTVVLLGLTFFAGAGVLITGDVINRRQEGKLRVFDSELTTAKLALDVETGKVAGLQMEALNAKTAQQKVETDLAKQQERAATAEKSLLELQKKLDWREISATQKKSFLAAAVGKHKGIIKIIAVSGDAEAKAYAGKLQELLKGAGWDSPPITTGLFLSPNDVGLRIAMVAKVAPTVVSDTQVSIPNDSPIAYGFDLITALEDSGFVIASHGIQREAGKEDEVAVSVGSKP